MANPRKRTLPGGNLTLTRLAERPQLDFELEFFTELLRRNPEQTEAIAAHAENLRKKGLYRESVRHEERRVELRPQDPKARVALARCYAMLGQRDLALRALQDAILLGWNDLGMIAHDSDFATLRTDPRFLALLRL